MRKPHKLAALGRVLDLESPEAALVFCRTRNDVDELTEALNGRGYRAEAMHGGMSQEERDRVMKKLRGGKVDLLVATDVAARGLDIAHLTHVVNYDLPPSPKQYVHRIGRVGRAGREGVAITLAEPREHVQLKDIERLTKQKIAVASIPTVADLQTRRLELTRASVRESILEGGTGPVPGGGGGPLRRVRSLRHRPGRREDGARSHGHRLGGGRGGDPRREAVPGEEPGGEAGLRHKARQGPAPGADRERISSSARAARRASVPRTSWEPSPARPGCDSTRSVPSRSPSDSPWWKSPTTCRTWCYAPSRPGRSEGRR